MCLFWGTTYLAIRIGVAALPPALFAGVRFLIAGTLLTPVLLWRGHKLPSARDLGHIAVVGIALLAVANGTVVWAEQWVPSGLAALIVAMIPFFMSGFEAWLPQGDKLNLKKIAGIVLGFAGLFLLVSPEIHGSMDRSYLVGLFAIVLAT
ncbi:MAG: multidrug DMT transporter permease, partial [Calditrichaeota bacterium]